MPGHFLDRRDAGAQRTARLRAYAGDRDVLVLALPRGGTPAAYEVAPALGSELDVLIVRKLGLPRQPELAMGAVASGGARHLNEAVLRHADTDDAALRAVEPRERRELERRERLYRGTRPAPRVQEQTVFLVDDGIAIGASTRAAVLAMRSLATSTIVAAVPVAPADAARCMATEVDEFVYMHNLDRCRSVADCCREFAQTTGAEVCALIEEAHTART